MRVRRLFSVFVAGMLVLTMALVGCDDDDDDPPGGGETIAINSEVAGQSLSISTGETITFVNESDDRTLLVIETADGDVLNQGDLEVGEEWEYTFDDTGNYVADANTLPDYQIDITVTD